MMKKIFYISIFLFTITSFVSCKKGFLSLENNPNVPSTSTPQFLLSGAEKVSAAIINTSYSTYGVWMGFVSPSGNYVPNSNLITYNFSQLDYQVWSPLYLNISNYVSLEAQSAKDVNLVNFQAIAKIMKVYNYQQLVDNYNNVPYSEAGLGTTNISPKYDKGEAIYDDLVKQLDEAMSLISGASATATNPGTSDIIYKGSMTKWVKFANSIKLRLILRQWNLTAKQAALKTAMQSTIANGFIDENSSAVANPGYLKSDAQGGQSSPFWISYGFDQNGNAAQNNAYYRANAYEVGLLKSKSDPRLNRIYATLTSGTYAGTVRGNSFGDPAALQNPFTSAIGPGLLISATMDANLMSASESLLLQAEAVERGIITGSSKDLFQRGITASFTALGVASPATAATTYYTQTGSGAEDANWDLSTDKIKAIITQKYIALSGYNNLETYNEYRRTGFPDVPRSVAAGALGTTLPSRIFYPSSEYQQNAKNVSNEGTIDRFTSKIFWAK